MTQNIGLASRCPGQEGTPGSAYKAALLRWREVGGSKVDGRTPPSVSRIFWGAIPPISSPGEVLWTRATCWEAGGSPRSAWSGAMLDITTLLLHSAPVSPPLSSTFTTSWRTGTYFSPQALLCGERRLAEMSFLQDMKVSLGELEGHEHQAVQQCRNMHTSLSFWVSRPVVEFGVEKGWPTMRQEPQSLSVTRKASRLLLWGAERRTTCVASF